MGIPQPGWGPMPAKENSFVKLINGKSTHVWIMASKIAAAVIVVVALISGIMGYSTVSRWTATLNGGLFGGGTPNTGLAVMTMFGFWISGLVIGVLIMLASDVATHIQAIQTDVDNRH